MKYNESEPHFLMRSRCYKCDGVGQKRLTDFMARPVLYDAETPCDNCNGNGYEDEWIGLEALQDKLGIGRDFWERLHE